MANKKRNANKTVIVQQLQRRNVSLLRKDIDDWTSAKQYATRVENPRMYLLQELYSNIMVDAHLSSQIQLRKAMPLGSYFSLIKPNGNIDEKSSEIFSQLPAIREILSHIIDAQLFGYSVIELLPTQNETNPIDIALIDRRHIDPVNGIALINQNDTEGIPYRELREYGKTILEFNANGLGLLDLAVPHVLYKRFAQACWSEFCEVCGMPPRYIKTNTQDETLRNRYLDILKDSGSGANFLIDTDDEVGFIDTHATGGEAYENLIRVCSNEISLLINGAVLGQDTRYGSNSKEQTSAELNDKLIKADFDFVEAKMNTIVLPALEALGLVPHGLRFKYSQQENTAELFQQTMQAAQYFDIDPKWVKEKFGIEVLGPRSFSAPAEPKDDKDNEDPQGEEQDDKQNTPNKNRYDPFA